MSKDMLGPTVRALVGVPSAYLPLIADIANRISDDRTGQDWHALLKKQMREGLPTDAKTPAPKSAVLKLVDTFTLDAVATHNPAEFFKTRKGLWISDEFKSRILTKAKPVENLDPLTLVSRKLTKNAYDREITPELGRLYIFDESEVCARIEQMISKQEGGGAGDLLNNGYANLFYVAGCVVFVCWHGDDREWLVFAWELDDGFWFAGDRAFSRN